MPNTLDSALQVSREVGYCCYSIIIIPSFPSQIDLFLFDPILCLFILFIFAGKCDYLRNTAIRDTSRDRSLETDIRTCQHRVADGTNKDWGSSVSTGGIASFSFSERTCA